MDQVKINVLKKYSGKTIKEFLKYNAVGKGKIEELRVKKAIWLNGVNVTLETVLKDKDLLCFDNEEEIDFIPERGDIEIVYEDDYLLVLNKPANILVHPDEKTKGGTLTNLVAGYYKKIGLKRKVRYAHRLDYETSGLIIFAKDFLTQCNLCAQLENHDISRKYLAAVHGKLPRKEGKITYRLGRDRHNSNKFRVSSTGKEAITYYKVLEETSNLSLVELELKTGRTHQIRVHLSAIQHPVVGDVLYGGDTRFIKRVALHSYKLFMTHPILEEKISLALELPLDMKKLTIKY